MKKLNFCWILLLLYFISLPGLADTVTYSSSLCHEAKGTMSARYALFLGEDDNYYAIYNADICKIIKQCIQSCTKGQLEPRPPMHLTLDPIGMDAYKDRSGKWHKRDPYQGTIVVKSWSYLNYQPVHIKFRRSGDIGTTNCDKVKQD